MALTAAELEKQKQQVEEMLAGPEHLGFAKSLFFGRFKSELLFPYPTLTPEKQKEAEAAVALVREFCAQHIAAAPTARAATIRRPVIAALARLASLGWPPRPESGAAASGSHSSCKALKGMGGT